MLNGCTEACSLLKKIYDHQIPKSLHHKTFKIMKLYFKKINRTIFKHSEF